MVIAHTVQYVINVWIQYFYTILWFYLVRKALTTDRARMILNFWPAWLNKILTKMDGWRRYRSTMVLVPVLVGSLKQWKEWTEMFYQLIFIAHLKWHADQMICAPYKYRTVPYHPYGTRYSTCCGISVGIQCTPEMARRSDDTGTEAPVPYQMMNIVHLKLTIRFSPS